ncbi:uncharacterized protein C4orf19 homolog [Tiliqua scincoides]|uniref:uncharacterized protein C4orf19 homolog n=1 Tax=Tiliqua scincoides TaxID=71010 RepID=UPI003462AB3F
MGCRCCKMIQSYIFDPQEVQTSGYVNEINNYKSDEQDGGKFNCKRNNDIQVHKNELHNADVQPPINRHKLNNTKDAIWNHKSTVLHEEGLRNCVEKSTFNINGIRSCSVPNPSPSMSQSNDVSTHVCSDQLSNSSAKGPSQPKECDDDDTITEDHPRLLSETTESDQYKDSPSARQCNSSAQSVICEAQSSDTHLLVSGDSQTVSQAGTQRDVASEHPNSHTHTHQSTECTILSKHGDLSVCKSRSCDSSFNSGPLSVCCTDDIPPPRPKAEVTQDVKYVCHEEFNGELEEDADVAEALAALEAATAGEDFEEEEEY